MGYISKDIAVITEPKIVSLSASPNFVQFASKPSNKTYLEVAIKVNVTQAESSALVITAPDGTVHQFNGTTNPDEVGGNTFFISNLKSDTAENLRRALLDDAWLAANFEITIPFNWVGGSVSNGDTLEIKSKGAGDDYELTIAQPINGAYTITWTSQTSINNDSISGEASTAEIDIDVYTDPEVFLGGDDRPVSAEKIGTYITTLSKTYAGAPVWFDLNALFNQYPGFALPPSGFDWFDPGTLKAYRFVAKVKAVNSYPFYQSNALYVLSGYGRPSEALDLTPYIYESSAVKLLTNKPKTTLVRGQKEYINFLFKDDQREVSNPIEFSLKIVYRAYTTAGDFLGLTYSNEIQRAELNIVNSCGLNFEPILDLYPNAGEVRVALARGAAIVSNDLLYEVRPECLHDLNAFTFLNRLGGWEVVNFESAAVNEVKPENSTYNKTITPDFKVGSSVETVYATTLEDTYTVEGAPVTDAVANWLKELAAARVILDNAGNYVIIDEFTLKIDPVNKNMHVPKIKYRLSESYTND